MINDLVFIFSYFISGTQHNSEMYADSEFLLCIPFRATHTLHILHIDSHSSFAWDFRKIFVNICIKNACEREKYENEIYVTNELGCGQKRKNECNSSWWYNENNVSAHRREYLTYASVQPCSCFRFICRSNKSDICKQITWNARKISIEFLDARTHTHTHQIAWAKVMNQLKMQSISRNVCGCMFHEMIWYVLCRSLKKQMHN